MPPHQISDQPANIPSHGPPPAQQDPSPPSSEVNLNQVISKRAQVYLLAKKYFQDVMTDRAGYEGLMNLYIAHTVKVVDFTIPFSAFVCQVQGKDEFYTLWIATGSPIYKQEKLNPQTNGKQWWSYLVEPDRNMIHLLVEDQSAYAPPQPVQGPPSPASQFNGQQTVMMPQSNINRI